MANCNDCICSEVCYYKSFNDVRALKKRINDVEKICKSFVHRDRVKGVEIDQFKNAPTVDTVDVKQYETLREQYHDLRENFIDYVCSGTCNVAPYCLNRCKGCVDSRGWCNQGSDECHGFNPAEVII